MAADGALIDEVRSGSDSAFGLLFAPLIEPGYRVAHTMLGSRAEAEDAVQEAVLRAWRKFGTLRADTTSVRAWFLAIVVNQCREMRRRRWFSVLKVERLEGASRSPIEDDLATLSDLRRALRQLRPEQRLVLYLRFNLDLPADEVGRVLGVSAGGARTHLHRALKALRVEMNGTEVEA